jgi:hypothetical protein
VDDWAKGLTKCVGSPVKMPEKSCTTKYMNNGLDIFCKNKDPACVAHKDGACQLSADQVKAFGEKMATRLGLSPDYFDY